MLLNYFIIWYCYLLYTFSSKIDQKSISKKIVEINEAKIDKRKYN